jgi:hypothetical protein
MGGRERLGTYERSIQLGEPPIRTEHKREETGVEGSRTNVGHAREGEAPLEHAQVLVSSGRHRAHAPGSTR